MFCLSERGLLLLENWRCEGAVLVFDERRVALFGQLNYT